MNANHYPSLDRCKKLTSLGFPKTEKSWNCDKAFIGDENLYAIQRSESPSVKAGYSIDLCVCPSVMEMMDVIPKEFVDADEERMEFGTHCNRNGNFSAGYVWLDDFCYAKCADTLPNAIADLIVWLVENGHIIFDKS